MNFGGPGEILIADSAFPYKKIEQGTHKRDAENDGEPCQGHPHGPSPHNNTDRESDDNKPVGCKEQGGCEGEIIHGKKPEYID